MIPKIVHRIWLGGDEPEWTQKFALTWAHPGWVVRTWTDSDLDLLFPLANQIVFDHAEEIAPQNVGQLRSDVLRYEILHRFGGVYVDTDFESRKPLDPLIVGVDCFAAWEVEDKWVNNAILGATKQHPLFSDLVAGLRENVERWQGWKPNRLTGPQYLTRVAGRHSLAIFPKRWFYPYLYSELHRSSDDFPTAYAVHHWANRRRERNAPL